MKSLFWIASYPKSGNTWVRLFLASYRKETDEPLDINGLGGQIASSRELFEEFAGMDSSELIVREIEYYRPRVYLALSQREQQPIFLKVHDAFTRNAWNEPLFPEAATAGVIYLVRNPLDVAVSYAHHGGKSFADTVRRMNSDSTVNYEAKEKPDDQLPQKMLSWSGHIQSWESSGLPLRIFRYEDLLTHPKETFAAILQFAQLPPDAERMDRALQETRFENLREQETREGFKERPAKATRPFFRRGEAGGWRDELPPALVRRIIKAHRPMMERFGYLRSDGQPA